MFLASMMPTPGWEQGHRWGLCIQLAPAQGLPGGVSPTSLPAAAVVLKDRTALGEGAWRPGALSPAWTPVQGSGLAGNPWRAVHHLRVP